MQLMPGAWRDMLASLGLGFNPHDPADNILAGTLYLRLMYDRFGYPGLFSGYNAGPAGYGALLTGARPLPLETCAYVSSLAPGARWRSTRPSPLATGLFAPHSTAHSTPGGSGSSDATAALASIP